MLFESVLRNTYDLSGEYSRADFDQWQRFNMLATSEIDKWLNLGIGLTAASGLPYTETSGLDLYNSGFANARPNGVGRNTLQGPGYMELDVRWSHDFLLSRKGDKGPLLTFAADAFNAVSHVNYSQFIGNERSPFLNVPFRPCRAAAFSLRCDLSSDLICVEWYGPRTHLARATNRSSSLSNDFGSRNSLLTCTGPFSNQCSMKEGCCE